MKSCVVIFSDSYFYGDYYTSLINAKRRYFTSFQHEIKAS